MALVTALALLSFFLVICGLLFLIRKFNPNNPKVPFIFTLVILGVALALGVSTILSGSDEYIILLIPFVLTCLTIQRYRARKKHNN